MDKFINTSTEEQETTINIDYMNKHITAYTNRKTVFYRWLKRFGEPTQTYYIKSKIAGAKWVLSFSDSRIKSVFSKTLLIGGLIGKEKR